MSRIGKKPIPLPDKTKAALQGDRIVVDGPKGKLEVVVPEGVSAKVEDGNVLVERPNETRQSRALQGLARSLISNAVTGVSTGYTRELEINGVGYRAEAKGQQIHFTLGYSHPVVYDLPQGISAKTPAPTKIVLEGSDKQLLGMTAANIRMLRPPEPYKGKGIKYAEENIRRKVGKTGA
jgi:large subunit ribosomal protein L6